MKKKNTLLTGLLSIIILLPFLTSANLYAQESRFSAAGYFRLAARPDFQGAWSKLGLWNLYGRLLNETQWAALEMRLSLLDTAPNTDEVWTSLHAKIEGGSAHASDILNGSLGAFALTQLYVKAGNILLKDVTWQLGTIHYSFGDLGLYDFRLAEIFFDTIGASLTYTNKHIDLTFGIGDAGYFIRKTNYNTILTTGLALRARIVDGFEIGLAAQLFYEPAEKSNKNAPHQSIFDKNLVNYESFIRKKIVEDFSKNYDNNDTAFQLLIDDFPKPQPKSALTFKTVGYIGFGKLGPLKWNNLYFNFLKKSPDIKVTESFKGHDFNIYVKEWTDDKYEFNIGNEMQLEIAPEILDITWAAFLGYHFDKDNKIKASEDNRLIWSVVLRSQLYFTSVVHLLLETSFAQEKSLNGRLWQNNPRAIRENTKGRPSDAGLEFGNLDLRRTWQAKTGFILNPGGYGIFSRPSLRFLYGVQHSNMFNAFPNNYADSINMRNEFYGADALNKIKDRHWHHIISIEAEAWF